MSTPESDRLFDAVRRDDVEAMRGILRAWPATVGATDDDGWGPLFFARSAEAIEALLQAGADLHGRDSFGNTPLHFAETVEAAEAFLAQGFAVDVRRNDGWTPLFGAIYAGRDDLVRFFLDKDADAAAAAVDSFGDTPLHVAADEGNAAVARLLLQRGVDPGASNADGFTPLLVAVMAGHEEVAAELLRAGAPVNPRTDTGVTPLDFAITAEDPALVELLLAHGGEQGTGSVKPRDPLTDLLRRLAGVPWEMRCPGDDSSTGRQPSS